MADIKKQIIDFDIDVISDNDSLILQSNNGTTFRAIANTLPYSKVENFETSYTKRPILNFGTQFIIVDNNGNNSTDIGINSLNWDLVSNTPSTLAGYGITDGNSSTSSFIPVISLTRQELLDLQTTSGLVAGSYYMINDFRTCYDQPDYDFNGNPITTGIYKTSAIEPIIVLALSDNKLCDNAYQPLYPKDKIKYDITWSFTEITENVAYGKITERIDEYGNRTDYDHRTIKFKRYRTYFYDLTQPLVGTITINNNVVVGTNTTFLTTFTVGSYLHVRGYDFKITAIVDDTNMNIEGHNLLNDSNLLYYISNPESDSQLSNITYTHTQMINGNDNESTTGDYIKDGRVVDGIEFFGSSSGYFTNLYPGLFIMSAYDININEFTIDGALGADGGGDYNSYQYSTSFNAINYSIYVKRVGQATDPSINHIIIVNCGTNGITRTINNTTSSDYDSLIGLRGNATQLHYLLTSKHNGVELTDNEISLVANQYLSLIDIDSIDNTLSSLNTNYLTITSLIPNIYMFNDNGLNYINDGGNDMYNGGNYLYTDLSHHWKSYNYKQNNIIDDTYSREMKTFQIEKELLQNGENKSLNNYIGNHSNFYNSGLSTSNFLLANNVFGMYSYSNTLGDRCFNNHTYNWFNKNNIKGTFKNNIITRGFYSNTIDDYFTNNIITGYFWYNRIGEEFNNNETGRDFYGNIIKNNFNNNYIINNFYGNEIGNDSYDNKIYFEFYKNIISHDFNNNNIHSYMNGNKIELQFQNNTLGDITHNYNFVDNIISNRFKGNLVMGDFNQNVIDVDFYANTMNGQFVYNKIGFSAFFNNFIGGVYGNSIKNYFISNTIGDNFNNNNILNNFQSNTTISNFQNNNFMYSVSGIDFSSATHVYNNYSCSIIGGSDNILYLNYFDGTTNLFVNINA